MYIYFCKAWTATHTLPPTFLLQHCSAVIQILLWNIQLICRTLLNNKCAALTIKSLLKRLQISFCEVFTTSKNLLIQVISEQLVFGVKVHIEEMQSSCGEMPGTVYIVTIGMKMLLKQDGKHAMVWCSIYTRSELASLHPSDLKELPQAQHSCPFQPLLVCKARSRLSTQSLPEEESYSSCGCLSR